MAPPFGVAYVREMARHARHRATFANITAVAALTLAVGGGTAYAAGLVGTDDLAKGAVTTPKIKKNAVTSKKVKNSSLKPADLAFAPVSRSVTRKVDIVFPDSGGGTGIFKDDFVTCEDGETVLGGGYHLSSVWSQNGQPTVIVFSSRPATATGDVPTAGTSPRGWFVAAEQKDNNTSTTVTVWVLCGS